MNSDVKKDGSYEFSGENFGQGNFHHPDALTADEILKTDTENSSPHSALDSLLKKVTSINLEDTVINSDDKAEKAVVTQKSEPKPQKSLLDKCMPYILDENGNDTTQNEKPLYELASVAEILREDSNRTLEKLSKEYGISFEGINKTSEETVVVPKVSEPQRIAETPKPQETEETETHVISDIDVTNPPLYNADAKEEADNHTITFTPITNRDENLPKIVVSSHTRPIDFTGELLKINDVAPAETEEVQLEKSDFEEFVPKGEYIDYTSGKALLKALARKKKKDFFSMWGSIFLTFLTAFFALPFMSNTILTHTTATMIITSVLTLAAVALNIKSFLGLGKIFRRTSSSDINTSLAVLSVALYSVFGIIKGEIVLYMQILLLVILSFNSYKNFISVSAKLRSFKQIFSNQPKNALTLINDSAITMAMTKGAVEGESLIAAPRRTELTEDFMKHTTFGLFLNGNINIITVISLSLAVLAGFIAAVFYNGILYGFYSAAAVLCLSSLPSIFLIDALPLYHSAKKLASKGAMIAGKTGAEFIEQANAVVINAKDIFPSGTVTLHQMKVLSDNNLEDTIIRAASLTDAMQSPLAPIFKKIAGNSNITVFPDSDTVKYEETLGISGWVDNRLLFIGNRTLMEAHSIAVPDVELDRKILRQGYFPVYVASGNKACALLIVRYDVNTDVSKELRRLTNSGVTLLVKTSDPNITEAMICDYLGLYEDTVKVMTSAGCHIYVNTTAPVKSVSAPAAFKANPTALPAILNCASRIKRSNTILTVTYVIFAILGILLFTYSSFGGSGTLLADTTVLIYSIVSTVITYLLYITQRP